MKKLLAIFQVVLCAGLSTYTFGQALPVLPTPNHGTAHNATISGKVIVSGSDQTPGGIIAILTRTDGDAPVPVSYSLTDANGDYSLTGYAGATYQVSYEFPIAGFTTSVANPSASFTATAGTNVMTNFVLTRKENTLTNCNVSDRKATNWNGGISVAKPEPTTAANLLSVSVFQSAGVANPTIAITANSTGAIYTKLDIGARVAILGPSNTPVNQLESTKKFAGSLVIDGFIDERLILEADQLITYHNISSAQSFVNNFTTPPTAYTGTGSVPFTISAMALTGLESTSGNSAFQVVTNAMAGVCLTYTYASDPLPVTLTSFSAKATSEGELSTVDVNWSTTTETNSEKFEVEKSADAKNWQLVGTKAAAQNSDVLNNYSFTDLSPIGGKSYYRLKMVDLDGSFAYSRIVGVQLEGGNIQMNLFPNPVAQQLFVQEAGQQSVKEVTIFNNAGNVVSFNKEVAADKGVDVKGLLTGTYLVRVKSNDGSHYTHRIVIAR